MMIRQRKATGNTRRHFWFAVLWATYFLALWAWRLNPDLRYLKYGLPLAGAIAWLSAKRCRAHTSSAAAGDLKTYRLLYGSLFALTITVLMVSSSTIPRRSLDEMYFVIAPLFFAASIYRYCPDGAQKHIYLVLAGCSIDYTLDIGPAVFLSAVASPDIWIQGLVTSNSPAESNAAFSFALIAIFCAHRRNWSGGLITLLLVILSCKRIALAGTVLGVAIALMPLGLNTVMRRVAVTGAAIAANAVVAVTLWQVGTGNLDTWFMTALGVSPDELLLGRRATFALAADSTRAGSLVGAGFGSTARILQESGISISNLHSDVLKHAIEFGAIGFVVWIAVIYWVASRNTTRLALLCCLNCLFVTDNVFIYFDVMFIYYALSWVMAGADVPVFKAVGRRPGSHLGVAEASVLRA